MADFTQLLTGHTYSSTIYFYNTVAADHGWDGRDGNGTLYFNPATANTYTDLADIQVQLQKWADVANIQIQGASSIAQTNLDIVIADFSPAPPADGGGVTTGVTVRSQTSSEIIYSHVAISYGYGSESDYGKQLLLHELGHALGLQHPGGDTHGANPDWDQGMTVMSYNQITVNGGVETITSPMLYDIAAIQHEYHPNTSSSGNTTYGGNFFSGGHVAHTVWDAGGKDTIDLTQSTTNTLHNVVVDLRGGTDDTGNHPRWSEIGDERVAIAWQDGHWGDNNYVVDIEAVKGTANGDVIYGNLFANTIAGASGNDFIWSGAGGGSLTGGGDNDTIVGGPKGDGTTANYISGDNGNDLLAAYFVNNTHNLTRATSDSSQDSIHGGSGNDTIFGQGGGGGYLFGEDGADTIASEQRSAGYGKWTIDGGLGNDKIWAYGGDQVVNIAGDGADTIIAGAPNWQATAVSATGDGDNFVAFQGSSTHGSFIINGSGAGANDVLKVDDQVVRGTFVEGTPPDGVHFYSGGANYIGGGHYDYFGTLNGSTLSITKYDDPNPSFVVTNFVNDSFGIHLYFNNVEPTPAGPPVDPIKYTPPDMSDLHALGLTTWS